MSKKLIAGAGVVAGLAIALAPLATFATSTELGTDTIQVTIDVSCNMEASGYTAGDPSDTTFTNTYQDDLVAGSYVDLDSSDIQGTAQATSIKVTCNDAAVANEAHGYQIKAAGTVLSGTKNTSTDIPMADPVTDGSASGWGAKYSKTATGDMNITSGYTNYKALTAAGVVIASGNVSAAAGDTLNIDGYRVSALASQEADTYTGTATYTFVAPQE